MSLFWNKITFILENNNDLFTFGPVVERLWILVTKIKIHSIDSKYCWMRYDFCVSIIRNNRNFDFSVFLHAFN